MGPSSPSNHVRSLVWSSWYSSRAQGTLLDPNGLPNGPQNEPNGANSAGKKALRDPFIAQINPFYLGRLDNVQI